MSGRTWLAAHYPVEASKVPKDAIKCLDHSILKWRGLLPGSLKRHGVKIGSVRDEVCEKRWGGLVCLIGSTSCALCKHWGGYHVAPCEYCPITELRGRTCCRGPGARGGGSEWLRYQRSHDPKPMLRLLRETRRKLLAEAQA